MSDIDWTTWTRHLPDRLGGEADAETVGRLQSTFVDLLQQLERARCAVCERCAAGYLLTNDNVEMWRHKGDRPATSVNDMEMVRSKVLSECKARHIVDVWNDVKHAIVPSVEFWLEDAEEASEDIQFRTFSAGNERRVDAVDLRSGKVYRPRTPSPSQHEQQEDLREQIESDRAKEEESR